MPNYPRPYDSTYILAPHSLLSRHWLGVDHSSLPHVISTIPLPGHEEFAKKHVTWEWGVGACRGEQEDMDIWGRYWENGKENGNYYSGFRVGGFGLRTGCGLVITIPCFFFLQTDDDADSDDDDEYQDCSAPYPRCLYWCSDHTRLVHGVKTGLSAHLPVPEHNRHDKIKKQRIIPRESFVWNPCTIPVYHISRVLTGAVLQRAHITQDKTCKSGQLS